MSAPRWRLRVGRATLTMVLSTTTRKTDKHRTGRMNQRRAWEVSITGIGGGLSYGTPCHCYSTVFFSRLDPNVPPSTYPDSQRRHGGGAPGLGRRTPGTGRS